MKRSTGGFTLIELMLVVSIISLLAAIAIPKFADLNRKAREAATQGNLGGLRGALRIYYADSEGMYPDRFFVAQVLTSGGKYIDSIPPCDIPLPGHQKMRILKAPEAVPHSDGGYFYYRDPWECTNIIFPTDGRGTLLGINIACNHSDLKGNPWGRGEVGGM